MNINTIVGARPQFIKAALVSHELNKQGVNESIIHTGQHYDDNMSDIFFREMNIPAPEYNLGIRGKTHGEMTGQMLIGIEELLMKNRPDLVLLYGDTNSTLAGALAARKLNIPIAHVEAGLRNFDFTIPEDVNRTITDRLSSILFCPTQKAIDNLKKEGFADFPCTIVKTGDLMADCVRVFTNMIKQKPELVSPSLRGMQKPYIVCTIHRQESTHPNSLPFVIDFLNAIAQEEQILFPIHPRTKKLCDQYDLSFHNNIKTIPPVGYFDMQYLLRNCTRVITDSGGLQKEAYLHQKYSLLLMDYTPWEELFEHRFCQTSSLDPLELKKNYGKALKLNGSFDIQLYGDGKSRKKIVQELIKFNNL